MKKIEDEFGSPPPGIDLLFKEKVVVPPPKKERFTLSTADELLAKPEPQLSWLIENVWVDKSRGLIAGNPGVGKTWLALDMLMAVCVGGLCFGKYQAVRGNVLLVEEEGSEFNLARRLHVLARARGLSKADLAGFFHLTRQFVKIPDDYIELCHLITEHDIRLVVFDSLRRFHKGDENSSSEMQPVLDAFAKINALADTSVILIHHLSKSNEISKKPIFERLRGSSDFWAWRDCLIGVEGEEESHISTCSFQFRDAPSQDPICLKRLVDSATGAMSLVASEPEDDPDFLEKSEHMVSYMQTQYGAVSMEQVLKNVRGRKGQLGRYFKAMVKRGWVIAEGPKWVVSNRSGTNGNDGNE